MERNPRRQENQRELTRVSVTGGAGWYTVRHGDEPPVRVRVSRFGLQCDCGRPQCSHIRSLFMCGFVGPDYAEARAA